MSLGQLGALVLMNLMGVVTPGPDIFLVTRFATRSRRHALAGTAGVLTGLLVWASLTVLGAAALLNAYPSLLGFIQLLGGAWILWMGQGMLRAGLTQLRTSNLIIIDADEVFGTVWQAYRQGVATNLSNPKVVLYFAALIAPLLPPNPGVITSVVVVAAIVLSAGVLFSIISLVISTKRMRTMFLKAGPWIDFSAGVFFLIAGAVLMGHGAFELLG
ncbi:LysE family translocator [Corynebacterium sp. A21]|uniref:LysE family translocator n=1 Tax=Corynebacterium sp. A21 TaxID=3457318 RepID=UPI003FD19918